jgi:hypothetical protein
MDDIATHTRKLVRPYVRSPKGEAVIASAKQLARLVLQDASLMPRHRNEVLSLVQWFVSEADGKHMTKYRSRRVVELAMHEPTSREKINHEHVFTREAMTQQLLAKPDQVGELLDEVIGCIVTKTEHDSMKGDGSGWKRYKNADIEVLDMSTVPPSIHDVG